MRKFFKWFGLALVGVAVIIALVATALYSVASSRMSRTHDIAVEAIALPSDSLSLARGKKLADAFCAQCHGADLAGKLLFEEPGIIAVYPPNITPSNAGLDSFTDDDYLRAIRHGVAPDGRQYMIMASELFIKWSKEDIASTIAYIKSVEPIDNMVPESEFSLMAYVMLGAGMMGDIFPAEYIDHGVTYPSRPEIAATVEYGRYLADALMCTTCHGDDLMGGAPPRGFPELGEVPPARTGAYWSRDQFLEAITAGVKPNGDSLNIERMPVRIFSKFSEDELTAIHMYLQELAGSQ